jgi:hypothetical protein
VTGTACDEAQERDLLEIEGGTPVLVAEQLALNQDGRPLELIEGTLDQRVRVRVPGGAPSFNWPLSCHGERPVMLWVMRESSGHFWSFRAMFRTRRAMFSAAAK